MKKESLKSFILRAICFSVAFIILFACVQEILRDKWIEGEFDPTVKVKGFYEEKRGDIDVVFFGSSQVYADIAPAVLYRDYGITSYDFCCNEQYLPGSYVYMKEAIKHQDIKLAVLDVYGVGYENDPEEGVAHFNIDDLPWNLNKVELINTTVPQKLRYSYYLPLTKYHGTWKEFTPLKYEGSFYEKRDVNRGWSPFVFYYEYKDKPDKEVLDAADDVFEMSDKNREYLDKIYALCKENDIPLLLIKTPTNNAERQLHANAAEKYAGEKGIPFLNMNLIFDGQSHINVLQSENVSQYVGAYIKENYDIPDHRGDEYFDNDWLNAINEFEEKKTECASLTKEDAIE